MTIYDGAVIGVQDPQCKNCANIDICKFTGMSGDLEKQLSDLADLSSTPFTITLTCKYRRINTYANTRALNPNVSDDGYSDTPFSSQIIHRP